MVNHFLPERGCGCPCKCCFMCMIVYNIIVLLFIFLNLCLQDWIYQGGDNNLFKGNLIQLYQTSGIWPKDTFDAVAYDLGDFANQYPEKSFARGYYEGLQDKFYLEYVAGMILIISSILGLTSFSVTLTGYLFTYLKKTTRSVGVVGATLGGVFFCVGTIVYLGTSHSDFTDNCEDFVETDEDTAIIMKSCRGAAAYFLVVNFLLAFFFSIITCSVMCCGLKQEKLYQRVKVSTLSTVDFDK